MKGRREPLRLGMVGFGKVAAQRHLPGLQRNRAFHVAAIADVDPDRLALAKSLCPGARHTRDAAELLAGNDLDAVAICSPPMLHCEQAVAAIQAGLPVFLETPVALSPEECARLQMTRDGISNGATVVASHSLRLHPMIRRARAWIRAGRLGEVHSMSCLFTTPARRRDDYVMPDWRRDDQTAHGCVLMEGGVHQLDLFSHLSGRAVETVSAYGSAGSVGLVAVMEGGVVASGVFSEHSGDTNELQVVGEEGVLSLSLYRIDGFEFCPRTRHPGSLRQRGATVAESLRQLAPGLRSAAIKGAFTESFWAQWPLFADAVRSGRAQDEAAVAPLATLDEGCAAARAARAAFDAWKTGQPVSLN